MDIITDAKDGSLAFASWFYCIESIAVHVIFATKGERRQALVNAWHPRFGNKLVIADFRKVEDRTLRAPSAGTV
jgi:hypothetical protein